MPDKTTDAWCVRCGSHADIVHRGKEYCASCYLKLIKKGKSGG